MERMPIALAYGMGSSSCNVGHASVGCVLREQMPQIVVMGVRVVGVAAIVVAD